MIKEFAVDPKLFGTSDFKLWSERFGPATGRMIAKFPENWVKCARKHIVEGEHGPVKRHSMKERLRNFDRKLIHIPRENYTYNHDVDWIDNAVFVQKEVTPPFYAIVSPVECEIPGVLYADEIDEDTEAFPASRTALVPKTGKDMAEAIALFLRTAKQVKFIDPHFDPAKPMWQKSLREFLSRLDVRLCTGPVEFHLRYDGEKSPSEAEFRRISEKELPRLIPVGIQVTFYRWRVVKERFHSRYVMDDRMGYNFEYGLNEIPNHQRAGIGIIDEPDRKQLWNEFSVECLDDHRNGLFELVDSTVIAGKMRRCV